MENYSKQREKMMEIMKGLYSHPTAEEIYFLVKQKDPAISKSTVYRNLSFLVQKGILQQIAVSKGPDRYDYKKDRREHEHVVCSCCGKVYDFYYNFDRESLKKSIEEQTGVEIPDDGMTIKGICNSCKNRKE